MNRLIFILMCLLFFIPIKAQTPYRSMEGSVFNTSYHIKYQYETSLDDAIRNELQKFDLSLNPFNHQSVIYKVNNNQPVKVDSFFITVFNKSREVSRKTGGRFDITCSPFINLWGFGFSSKPKNVNKQTIDSLKKYVGYKKIRLKGRRIVKDYPEITINTSAIAKGYSCDVVARLLESYGVRNYMIEIGGEITMKGKNPKGTCWMLEVSRPDDDKTKTEKERQTVICLDKGGLATSGDYRNYYVKDGKKYAHTINPLSGYPAGQNILSATVIALDCMTADAYATAFMVMGEKDACKLAGEIP